MEAPIYVKAKALGVDENGNPARGSIKIKFGEFKAGSEIPYGEFVKSNDPMKFMEAFTPYVIAEAKFITPEEYAENYG